MRFLRVAVVAIILRIIPGALLILRWTKVQRYAITPNKATLLEDLGESCIEDSKPGCVDMGTVAQLKSFINFNKKNYAADRYILILWNHGGGPVEGYGASSQRAGEFTVPQLVQAVKESDITNFDIIGFDACLMGSAEVAHAFRNYGKYLVASEEVEPGNGWDYKVFLRLTPFFILAFHIYKLQSNWKIHAFEKLYHFL